MEEINEKYLSVESKKFLSSNLEVNTTVELKPTIKPVNINDILEVTNDENKSTTCKY